MDFTTVKDTAGKEFLAIFDKDVSDNSTLIIKKNRPGLVWVNHPDGRFVYHQNAKAWWHDFGIDCTPLFYRKAVWKTSGNIYTAVYAKDCVREAPPSYNITHPYFKPDGIWIHYNGWSYYSEDSIGTHITVIDDETEEKMEDSRVKYKSSKFRNGYEIKGITAAYIADSSRSIDRDKLFSDLRENGFWSTNGDNVTILGKYIEESNFCEDGKKRAFEYFGLERIELDVFEEHRMLVSDLCTGSVEWDTGFPVQNSEYFWRHSEEEYRPVLAQQLAQLPNNAEIIVYKKVKK